MLSHAYCKPILGCFLLFNQSPRRSNTHVLLLAIGAKSKQQYASAKLLFPVCYRFKSFLLQLCCREDTNRVFRMPHFEQTPAEKIEMTWTREETARAFSQMLIARKVIPVEEALAWYNKTEEAANRSPIASLEMLNDRLQVIMSRLSKFGLEIKLCFDPLGIRARRSGRFFAIINTNQDESVKDAALFPRPRDMKLFFRVVDELLHIESDSESDEIQPSQSQHDYGKALPVSTLREKEFLARDPDTAHLLPRDVDRILAQLVDTQWLRFARLEDTETRAVWFGQRTIAEIASVREAMFDRQQGQIQAGSHSHSQSQSQGSPAARRTPLFRRGRPRLGELATQQTESTNQHSGPAQALNSANGTRGRRSRAQAGLDEDEGDDESERHPTTRQRHNENSTTNRSSPGKRRHVIASNEEDEITPVYSDNARAPRRSSRTGARRRLTLSDEEDDEPY